MKQVTALFALLLAASLTVGCGHCDPAETAVYWTFTDASNRTTTSCSAAGVATIQILVNNQLQVDAFHGTTDLACADYDAAGGAVVPVYTPHDTIEVDAYDRSGNLLYFSKDTVPTNSCGLKAYDANLTAQAGSITVNLSGFTQCPANSFVWYSLTDVTDPANPFVYSTIDGRNGNPQSIPCGAAFGFDAVPFGNYRLDFVQIVRLTSDPLNPYGAVYQNCSAQPVSHSANDLINVTLVPAITECRVP